MHSYTGSAWPNVTVTDLQHLFDDDNNIIMMLTLVILSVSDERSDRQTFSGKWLAGSTSVTSLEGDDVTLSCIFSGR